MNRCKYVVRMSTLALIVGLFPTIAWAQGQVSGSIAGVVKDSSGGGVAGGDRGSIQPGAD